jgi:hypothetical protein
MYDGFKAADEREAALWTAVAYMNCQVAWQRDIQDDFLFLFGKLAEARKERDQVRQAFWERGRTEIA